MKLSFSILCFLLLANAIAFDVKMQGKYSSGGLKRISTTDETAVFSQTKSHSYIKFTFPHSIKVANNKFFNFTLEVDAPGKISLSYQGEHKEQVSIDATIHTVVGKRQYRVPIEKLSCGKKYASKKLAGYQLCGGKNGILNGIRVDFWYKAGVKVELSNVYFDEGTDAALPLEASTMNFIPNGDFEFNSTPYLPDSWGDGGWGIKGNWQSIPEKWRNALRLDTSVAKKGKQSLRLKNSKGLPRIQAMSCYINVPIYLKGDKTWTVSAWVRGPAGAKVNLAIVDRAHRAVASKDFVLADGSWQKLSFKLKLNEVRAHVRILPKDDGVFNIDAVAMDKTPGELDYVPCMLDKFYFKKSYYGDVIDYKSDKLLPLPEVELGPSSIRDGIFMVNSKPFIPYVLGVQYPPTTEMMKAASDIGFNGINFYYLNVDSGKKIFDTLRKLKLRSVPWMKPKTIEAFTAMAKVTKDDNTVLANDIIDEPHNPWAKEVLERQRISKREAPQVPIMVNYRTAEINRFRNKMTELPGDIISADQYPAGNIVWVGSVYDCAELIERMFAKLAPAGKPVWNFFQITGNAYMNTREPTPAEYEGMLYSSLIAGCRGFITFQNQPFSKDLWITAGRVGKEFHALTPVLYAPRGPRITCSAKQIKLISRKYKGWNYVICVNASEHLVSAKFNFPPKVETAFEDRAITNGKDSLKPHQRRIYRWRQR